MRQPFAEWGVDLVLLGHEHVYERMTVDNIPYIINGLGGHNKVYDLAACTPNPYSKKLYNNQHGALLGVATDAGVQLCFFEALHGTLIDSVALPLPPPSTPSHAPTRHTKTSSPSADDSHNSLSAWRYLWIAVGVFAVLVCAVAVLCFCLGRCVGKKRLSRGDDDETTPGTIGESDTASLLHNDALWKKESFEF